MSCPLHSMPGGLSPLQLPTEAPQSQCGELWEDAVPQWSGQPSASHMHRHRGQVLEATSHPSVSPSQG